MPNALLDYALSVTTRGPMAAKTADYTKKVLAIVKSKQGTGKITPCITPSDVRVLTEDTGVLELFSGGMKTILVLPISTDQVPTPATSTGSNTGSSSGQEAKKEKEKEEIKKKRDEIKKDREKIKKEREKIEEERKKLNVLREEAEEAQAEAAILRKEAEKLREEAEKVREEAEKLGEKAEGEGQGQEQAEAEAKRAETRAKEVEEQAKAKEVDARGKEEKVRVLYSGITKLEDDISQPKSELEITVNELIEKSKHEFFTILISSELSETFKSFNFGTFEGVVGCSFTELATAKTFATAPKRCGFYSTSESKAKNMFHAFGKLLSYPTWQNHQYEIMPCDDAINNAGQAKEMFGARVSFVLTSKDDGRRLAFFSAGGHAITSPYILESLKFDMQRRAISYIQSNNPDYILAQASLLEAALLSDIERKYVATKLITSASVKIDIIEDNFRASGTVEVPQPKALWGVDVTLSQV